MKLNEIEVILFDLGNVVIEIDFSRVISEWQKFSGKNNIDVTKDSILGRTNEKYERGENLLEMFQKFRVFISPKFGMKDRGIGKYVQRIL